MSQKPNGKCQFNRVEDPMAAMFKILDSLAMKKMCLRVVLFVICAITLLSSTGCFFRGGRR